MGQAQLSFGGLDLGRCSACDLGDNPLRKEKLVLKNLY
jgi:hypothetical protein